VLHGVEHHAQGLAAYSLGNFLFANTDERSRLSGVLRVRYQPGQRCPERASFHPVWLGEGPGYRPAAATGDEAKQIRDRVASLSKKLKTPLVADGEALVVETWRCDQAAPTAAAK
jgi:poly-gamma-glutamate capsule biosynthesis protein CapA/YwtB (metallophosphatase superfamily)